MEATRELFWNVNGKELMYFLAAISLTVFIFGCHRKIRIWQIGRREKPLNGLKFRLKSLIAYVMAHQSKVFKGKFYRTMHLAMFYGFLILLIGTLVIALQADFHIPLFYGKFYLFISFFLDLFGMIALLGVLMAVYKRYVNKPERFENTTDDAIIFTLLFLILSTGFVLEGLRIYLTGDPWAVWTPIGLLISTITEKIGLSIPLSRSVHSFLWYLHMLLAFGFIAYVPYSKLFHMLASPLNLFLSPTAAKGTLLPNNGVARYVDFSRKQLIELDACVSCGRCQKNCPSYLNGAPLAPKRLVQTLKEHAHSGALTENIDSFLAKKTLWSCTTCGLCEEKCPLMLEHVNRIVDLRRNLVTRDNGYPPEIYGLFDNLLKEGNPWALNVEDSNIYKELEIPLIREKGQTDVLYWVGCFGAYESRNINVTKAMLAIFRSAGIDFAVLGPEEKCCGDSARRLGNEKVFQQLALENIELLKKYKFNTIVTQCPHCFNTLKNEYPQLGGNFTVLHHSQFILDLIKSGKIRLKENVMNVTYHDPCYLGRFNNIYEEPRNVLTVIPGMELFEIKHDRAKSFCCGAGGGRIWFNDELTQKINLKRIKEAIKTEADVLASACPLCLTSFTDTINSSESHIKTRDIAEIVQDALQST